MSPRKPHIRAVPWKTSTEEKIKGALGEVPAYIRRARSVEVETARLFDEAGEARDERLPFVCLRFRQLLDLLDEETARELGPETLEALGGILDVVEDADAFLALPAKPRRPRNAREVPRALAALRESVARFNTKWERWIREEAPLDRANRVIEGYNRHYAFERQCAVKYIPLDKLRTEKKVPLTVEDLLERFPYLPSR